MVADGLALHPELHDAVGLTLPQPASLPPCLQVLLTPELLDLVATGLAPHVFFASMTVSRAITAAVQGW